LLLVGGLVCFALCFLLVGGTCVTRVTCGTFDFQEEDA